MSLPAIPDVRLLEALSGTPIATASAVHTVTDEPVRLLVVTTDVDPVLSRRIRGECGELEAILAGVDPSVVLPIVDHGVDDAGRPYLLSFRPGPELAGPLSPAEAVVAAKALATGLTALAERGVLGPPRGLHPVRPGVIALGTPLPPALMELESSLGVGTGLEPPEVLGGDDWTPAGQVYACAWLLWTLLDGRSPYGKQAATLARLVTPPPPRMRADVPEEIADLLRTALAIEPAARPRTPLELARALRAAVEPEPGTWRLGSRYLLETRVGSGVSGEVWAGHRIDDQGRVAVKVLRGHLTEDEVAMARFVREYKLLQGLRHPHLLRVHDLVIEDGVLAIVMDFVDGEDLHRMARRGPLPLAEVAGLIAQIADGLAAVHAAGLVHRDVKPANVLVTRRDGRLTALLSDFGIARSVKGAAHTQPIGTPAYLAPEIVVGRPPTPAADVYALGVTAYELLAGRPPFQAEHVDALVRAHLEGTPPRPDGLDDHVWECMAACLVRSPEERPTAAEAAARWAALAGSGLRGEITPPRAELADEPSPAGGWMTLTSARPLPERPPETPPRRPRRLVIATTAAAVAGLAIGVGAAMWQSAANDAPPVPARTTQQYTVPASIAADAKGVGTITWTGHATGLPGFKGFLVADVSGDRARPVSPDLLPGDDTSYRVRGLRPGRRACYVVIAVGVTATPPADPPPATCVTPPRDVRTPDK
ncbi:serine/threonine-protein kinase [Streptosporangium sp. NPDC048865]|uniref:serine/threonine-protein kinase n=1 Tax=Streptosporangium sp. NPDC048865 TaxID=3155766 RepID=UPI003436E417